MSADNMFLWLLLTLGSVSVHGINNDLHSQLPRLFHMDDYEKCLADPGGLYCLGTFRLSPGNNSHVFDLIQTYSKQPLTFNRTLLHRGYCVSERCSLEKTTSEHRSEQTTPALRFERCAAKQALRYPLNAHLLTAECTTHHQHKAQAAKPDAVKNVFIYVFYAILGLNVIGTVYDVIWSGNSSMKFWSVRRSWQILVKNFDTSDPRMKPLSVIQGVRVFAIMISTAAHTCVVRYKLYAYHPHHLETLLGGSFLQTFTSSTSLLHVFVMISSFLTSYALIQISETRKLTISMLPLCIIKRVIRISPTYLFITGFAATWWYSLSDGPLWSSVVVAEEAKCRRTYWTHAFYLNNVNPTGDENMCLTPTWFLAADMHAYIFTAGVTLVTAAWGRKALYLHGFLFSISCIGITALAYANEWKPMMLTVSPDNFRTVFSEDPSFHHLYMSSWIMLPACFTGMFWAHLYVELQKTGTQLNNKWFKLLFASFPIIVMVWLNIARLLRDYPSVIFTAMHIGLHRPLLVAFIGSVILISFYNQEHFYSRLFSWKGWDVLSHLSLPVLMLHWIVLYSLAGSRQTAMSSILFNIIEDWIVTVVISYVMSIPISVLLEIPAQKFFGALFGSIKAKAE